MFATAFGLGLFIGIMLGFLVSYALTTKIISTIQEDIAYKEGLKAIKRGR